MSDVPASRKGAGRSPNKTDFRARTNISHPLDKTQDPNEPTGIALEKVLAATTNSKGRLDSVMSGNRSNYNSNSKLP